MVRRLSCKHSLQRNAVVREETFHTLSRSGFSHLCSYLIFHFTPSCLFGFTCGWHQDKWNEQLKKCQWRRYVGRGSASFLSDPKVQVFPRFSFAVWGLPLSCYNLAFFRLIHLPWVFPRREFPYTPLSCSASSRCASPLVVGDFTGE